jgi:DNA-directed RNA polymerase subunit beta
MQVKIFSRFPAKTLAPPSLNQIQIDSYQWFFDKGLKELFEDFSPIRDHTGKKLELWFKDYHLDDSGLDEFEAQGKNLSYEASLRVEVELKNLQTGEIKKQEIYFGEVPLITRRGTFIINGVERAVVSQLIRSAGVYFNIRGKKDRLFFGCEVIPARGAWIEFEVEPDGRIMAKVDRRRKFPATALLRAFGLGSTAEIKKTFKDLPAEGQKFLAATLAEDVSTDEASGLVEVYKRLRPGELATPDNARDLISGMFSFERYDLEKSGRWKVNQRLKLKALKLDQIKKTDRVIKLQDLIAIVKEVIRLNLAGTQVRPDDIDHLGNRRVRPVGMLFQSRLRQALTRMERLVKDRMTTHDIATMTPSQLVHVQPFVAAVQDFFGASRLSQFMDQINPLAELEHKRKLSAKGPGGLTSERAGFGVRDVHSSHYGRICPIQTPEGQNIGLVNQLAIYTRLNEMGFLETPYFRVKKGQVTSEVVYLDARKEEEYIIAHGGELLDSKRRFKNSLVEARIKGAPGLVARSKVQFIDVSPQQILSVATALIPFLEHDDANRALMGSNMQKQAVPCIKPEAPLVATGIEARAARDSGYAVFAETAGKVVEVDANHIVVEDSRTKKKHNYNLLSFIRSNQCSSLAQKPRVEKGQNVAKGQVLADGAAIEDGLLALGQNLVVAFMSWEGSNYEDAVVISERLLKEDIFTSIHIESFTTEIRDTKLGPEQTTFDIPNVSEARLANLDEEGIIRIGAEVQEGDILVGKIAPKGEADLTGEERLLRAVFGEKARDVKDVSLRLPHGKKGRIVGVREFSKAKGDKLSPGVIKSIEVEVAALRKVQVGDKLAGRHGNKGVIAKILPIEDMPHLEDGTVVDVILNPLGVASRMNLGQILESHLGWSAKKLGFRAISPALSGATEKEIKDLLKEARFPEDGKTLLYDGRTGQPFHQKVAVGVVYIMKLNHLVEDKVHARSIGPYSLTTQQPLGGKAQFGGQRFGEMEVWAMEGYGAAYSLQEMLTVKSDDVIGRARAYEAITQGRPIPKPGIPASFNVMLAELKGLGLDPELIKK